MEKVKKFVKLSCYWDHLAKKWNNKTSSGAVFRNMVVLASGTGVAKIFGSLSIPVITRIYSPEHMGVLSVFVALTGMLVPFGTLRYSIALPLPKNDGMATNLFVLCMMSLCVMSSVSVLILWLFAPPILEMLSMQDLVPYWWLLIIMVIGAGLYEIFTQWAIREKAFTPVAKTQVWQSLSGAGVKIGLGLVGLKPLGLLIGQIVTQAGGILSLARIFRQNLKSNTRYVTKSRLLFMLKHYSDFPKYRLPSQFLLMFAIQTPLLFSAWLFGSETTGQLGLALMALALPMSLFGQSTGQAYYAEIAKIGRKNPRKIYILTKNITKKLFWVSIPPFLILIIMGPYLFSFVFGEHWREAGVFSRILAIYLMTQFVSSPLVNALSVFEKQWMFLCINIIRSILVVLVFGISYLFKLSPVFTIFIYSIALSIHYINTSAAVFRVIRKAKM